MQRLANLLLNPVWKSGLDRFLTAAGKRALEPISDDGFGDVVKHVPEHTWQEERESLLQVAIKRWLVVVIGFRDTTTVWKQVANEKDALGKWTVLSDPFRGKAPATLLKTV